MTIINFRMFGQLIAMLALLVLISCAQNNKDLDKNVEQVDPATNDWDALVAAAEGQEMFWHAWGGSPIINSYIVWVAEEVKIRYGIKLTHVKISDTANVVSQVLAEKTSGKDEGGSVDMVWINGENFKSMKENGLLFGPFAEKLPNFSLVDTKNKPTTLVDFTIPTDGFESPWGMAQLNFIYDSARITTPPNSLEKMLAYAKENPGRITYPAPPDFMGSTFLKQVLYETLEDSSVLQQPVNDASFRKGIRGLATFLDNINPYLWQRGDNYPKDSSTMERLLADNEIDIAITFNPGHASEAISDGRLPETVRTFVMEDGTIGNTHFVAIPYNANAKAAAQVVADFLISAEAQVRKSDPSIWGDPTVLGMSQLNTADRELFENLPVGPATLSPQELGKVLPEPHPSWMERVEKFWLERYAR